MKENLSRVFLLFVDICIGDPSIKMECWNHITRIDFATEKGGAIVLCINQELDLSREYISALNAEQLPLFGIH